MYLANGVDAMLINLLGSGDAWAERCDYGAPLTGARSKGWYKCDRRTHTDIDLVYGIMFPLFEFASSPMLNGDLAVPRDGKQYFDPRKATLTTFYEQTDNATGEWLRVRVTTFLTKNHVLVEHYEFLEAPASGAAITFFLNSPSEPRLHFYERAVKMDHAALRVKPAMSLMSYDFIFEDFRGGARSWFDCESSTGVAEEKKGKAFVFGQLTTRTLRTGESFTRYLAAIDNKDAPNYRSALASAVAQCRVLGYRRIQARHEQEWRRYFETSRVAIPDAAISFLYDVSRYLLNANLHLSGFLPVGLFPYLWQGVMFWDSGFAVQALLGCGNVAEARRILDHLPGYLPQARKLARRFHARGARLEWTVGTKDFTQYPFLVSQVHNNAWWAYIIAAFCRTTADRQFLQKHFDMIGEFLLFLTDGFMENRGDHWIVRQCEGVDESVTHKKTNDTWTCAVTLKALQEYRDAAQALKRRPVITNLAAAIAGLRAGLARNVDDQGVLQSFLGGRLPHWGSLIFDLFPEHPALKPTIAKMMENYDPAMRLYNFHGVTRYAEKAFPWANYWAARTMARVGDPLAHRLIVNAARSVNYFGGMPERVFYHGELFNDWTLTVHASMVCAVNTMLASATGDTLRILGGMHRAWRDVEFSGILAGDGLIVSATVRFGHLDQLEIVNKTRAPRKIICVLGNKVVHRLTLRPGRNRWRGQTLRASRS